MKKAFFKIQQQDDLSKEALDAKLIVVFIIWQNLGVHNANASSDTPVPPPLPMCWRWLMKYFCTLRPASNYTIWIQTGLEEEWEREKDNHFEEG